MRNAQKRVDGKGEEVDVVLRIRPRGTFSISGGIARMQGRRWLGRVHGHSHAPVTGQV